MLCLIRLHGVFFWDRHILVYRTTKPPISLVLIVNGRFAVDYCRVIVVIVVGRGCVCVRQGLGP